MRTGGEVIADRFAHRRQNRDHALFASFAGDHQHFAERCFAAGQPERFGEPQAAAIEQRQDRSVALAFPSLGSNLDGAVERACCIFDRQRLWHAVRQLRRAKRGERRRGGKPTTLQETYKPAQHRKPAGKGAALYPVLGPARQIGTEIAGPQRIYCGQARQLAQMLGQEIEKKREIAPVCSNGMRRSAALAAQPAGPQSDCCAQIVGRRKPRERHRFRQRRESGLLLRYRVRSSHCAIVISSVRARKVSSSVPRPG